MELRRCGILFFVFASFLSMLLTTGCAKEASDSQPVAAPIYDWNQNQGEGTDDQAAEDCSSSSASPTSFSAGIVGGEQVHSGNWLGRGIVFLMQGYKGDDGHERNSICTASLIDSNIVLTAAHCVDRAQGSLIGNLSVYFTNQPECENKRGRLQKFKHKVTALRIHPDWAPDNTSLTERGDLALVRISGKAPKNYEPLKLASEFVPISEISPVLVAGYGMVNPNYYGEFGGDIALRVTQVQGISAEKKASLLQMSQSDHSGGSGPATEFDNVSSSEMLYIDQSQGKGICGGDSGGPSIMKNSHGENVVTGIASFVMNPEDPYALCGYVAAHTSVIFYKDWINQTFVEIKDQNSVEATPFR